MTGRDHIIRGCELIGWKEALKIINQYKKNNPPVFNTGKACSEYKSEVIRAREYNQELGI